MAGVLRTAVHSIVLGTGPQLAVFRFLGTLQASHHLGTHHARQVGVFAVGLLSPSPPWVAEDIDIGSPHRQAVKLLVLTAVQHPLVILRPELSAGSVEHLPQRGGVKRSCHGNRLGKDGDIAHVGCSVQSLAPPEELLDAQPGNGRTLVEHQLSFLFQRQPGTQVDGTFTSRQVRVLVR